MSHQPWDQRFGIDEFVYGVEPNDHLKASVAGLKPGVALSLGDGEGRNGVYLAQLGWKVTAVDFSSVGLAKAQKLAESRGVTIETQVADLSTYDLGISQWDLVVQIFCHLDAPLRHKIHRAIVQSLKPGGTLILEGYTPRQLGRGTGGPPVKELLYEPEEVRPEFAGLDLLRFEELERDVIEGRLHSGRAAVLQVVGRKG